MAPAAQTPMATAARKNAARATPPIQTSINDANRNQRYSYMETPVEMQRSTFEQYHQFSSPTNSTIDESPVTPASPGRGLPAYPQGPQATTSPPLPLEKSQLQSPHEVHPAFYAPYEVNTRAQQAQTPPASNRPTSPGPIPVKMPERPAQPAIALIRQTFDPPPKSTPEPNTGVERRETYNPDSLSGPNGAPTDNHRPGQVSHPNANVDPHWKHGLCEPDTLCCSGIICPCMVYGKTTYRLSTKAQKQDPTDLLGYESCNGACGLMAVACGFQCGYLALVSWKRDDLTLF